MPWLFHLDYPLFVFLVTSFMTIPCIPQYKFFLQNFIPRTPLSLSQYRWLDLLFRIRNGRGAVFGSNICALVQFHDRPCLLFLLKLIPCNIWRLTRKDSTSSIPSLGPIVCLTTHTMPTQGKGLVLLSLLLLLILVNLLFLSKNAMNPPLSTHNLSRMCLCGGD
ncbi:hypothetical protein CsSME_00000574 [Camellia sinensis var. sinensis]